MQKKWLSYFGILTCATLCLGAEEYVELQASDEAVGEVAYNDSSYLAQGEERRDRSANSESDADKAIEDADKAGDKAADRARREATGSAEDKEKAARIARDEASARVMRDQARKMEKDRPVVAAFLRARAEARELTARELREHPETRMKDAIADGRDREARYLDNHADDEGLTERERDAYRERALRGRMEARAWREGGDVRTRDDVMRRRDEVRREGDRQVRAWRSMTDDERRMAFGEGVHEERAKAHYHYRWTTHYNDHHDARRASMEAHDDLGRWYDDRAKDEDRRGHHMDAMILRSRGEGEREEVRALRDGRSFRDARVRKFERVAVAEGRELKEHGRDLSGDERIVIEIHIRGNAERADNERRMPEEGRNERERTEIRRLRRENHALERDLRDAREHPEDAEKIRDKNPKLRARASAKAKAGRVQATEPEVGPK